MTATDARNNMLQATRQLFLIGLRQYIDEAITKASREGAFALENPWAGSPLEKNQVAIERVLDSLRADGFGITYLNDQTNPAAPLRVVVDWQIRKQTGDIYGLQRVG
jgi:hypothetical protein